MSILLINHDNLSIFECYMYMMSSKKRGKVSVDGSRPDLPPFLQRMREQIVATEDAERKAASEKRRKTRANQPDDPDDDPAIVRLSEGDLTEAEYKRMKRDLETKYKLDQDNKDNIIEDLEVDLMTKSRTEPNEVPKTDKLSKPKPSSSTGTSVQSQDKTSVSKKKTKKLSYESSDEED